MLNKNQKENKKKPIIPPAFTTNSLTNYKYVNGDKSDPKLSDEDVVCAKKWVDANEK